MNGIQVLYTMVILLTTFEGKTVILPCAIGNLRPENLVIWQLGQSGQMNQSVLTIGNNQLVKNYRLRIITNADGDNVNSFNIELRRLQLNDSGWYECQLNTKPTLKNNIYLKVLNEPKIHYSPQFFKFGHKFELVCEMRMQNANDNLSWTKSGVILKNANHIIEEHYKVKDGHGSGSMKIINKLIIKKLRYDDRGIYACTSDEGAEKNFELNFSKEIKQEKLYSLMGNNSKKIQSSLLIFTMIMLKSLF